jgi:hypothetical protein
MTVEQIQIRQQQAASKFELAARIRKWLDDAKSEWKGEEDWDDGAKWRPVLMLSRSPK